MTWQDKGWGTCSPCPLRGYATGDWLQIEPGFLIEALRATEAVAHKLKMTILTEAGYVQRRMVIARKDGKHSVAATKSKI